ncbi:hypothetical protein IC797_12815 [Acinetobacter seifertii]|uniref:hypothetical protein n=1 Tax=Acinetobacter seifertii TaxID=1530123 RepID=UPI00168CE541|nr:hypothetical protein [Acinetobacter seifertii]QNW97216.1 hypothetical protein IC797_12815 [Acinetobacter seifertii]
MSFLKKLLIMCLMFQTTLAYSNSGFQYVDISQLTVHDYGNHIFVVLKQPAQNDEKCTNNYALALQKSHPLFKEMYATLIFAFANDIPIAGWVNGCSEFGYPILTRLDIKK